MAIHIATYFATKSDRWNFVEISLNFRWNFVVTWFDIRYLKEISTKFQRIFFVAKLCGKTFCHIPKLRNYLGFNEILGLWQFVLPQNFATKMIVEISLNFRSNIVCQIMLQRNFNESSTNFPQRFFVAKLCGKMRCHKHPTNFQRISNEFPTKDFWYSKRRVDLIHLYWAFCKTCRVTF